MTLRTPNTTPVADRSTLVNVGDIFTAMVILATVILTEVDFRPISGTL